MNHRSADEQEARFVHPARDAERSDVAFNDTGNRNDPQHRLFSPQEGTSTNRALAPIGVFDSGAGGLTILTALRQVLPQEDYIYFGDTGHVPYGPRREEEIVELTVNANRFLVEQGVKLIVVACNTASQAALGVLRATFAIPFVGVVPAVKPAARATKRGRIGVVATSQAVKAAYLRQLIDDFAGGIEVFAAGCPDLVTLVEEGEFDGPQVDEALKACLQPMLDEHIDVLVLGCTHFPAMRPAIERLVGKQVQVIDSGTAIARRTYSILEAEGLLRPERVDGSQGELQIWCSGDAHHFSQVASALLGYPVTAHKAHV